MSRIRNTGSYVPNFLSFFLSVFLSFLSGQRYFPHTCIYLSIPEKDPLVTFFFLNFIGFVDQSPRSVLPDPDPTLLLLPFQLLLYCFCRPGCLSYISFEFTISSNSL